MAGAVVVVGFLIGGGIALMSNSAGVGTDATTRTSAPRLGERPSKARKEERQMYQATAQASIIVNAPRKWVWHALTDPELIQRYFMCADVTTDWQVGSPITFAGEWQGTTYEDKGEVLTFAPDEELCFSHWSPMSKTEDAPENYHVVDITLGDADGGTEVTLTQSNLTGGVTDADRRSRAEYEKNWASTLEGLKQTVEGARQRS